MEQKNDDEPTANETMPTYSNEMNGILPTTARTPGVATNKPERDPTAAVINETTTTTTSAKNDIEIPSADSTPSTTITTSTLTGGYNKPMALPVLANCQLATGIDDLTNCSANRSPQTLRPPIAMNDCHELSQSGHRSPSPLSSSPPPPPTTPTTGPPPPTEQQQRQQRDSLGQLSQLSTDKRHRRTQGLIVRRFQKFDAAALSSAPAPDVKIGQRVAYKEYYGNEFGTIRWIGRVPQISPDWTVGVEFDNAIGEGDGSLNGRRYFIAKDCFAKFLPLVAVALVDQHVGRPEPGTMISVMSAAVRPGQMISIQRVSTVHVQHCFLNAPHRRPGAEFLAVNTRLHCQCPSCGPCAHVVKPPRTQRLMTPKNATHMCQFSTYTCCGMESSDEALCTYTGNKISSLPPPPATCAYGGASLPPIGNSWMEGSGYLTNLQAEQRKLMPEEYRLGAAPEDTLAGALLRRGSSGRRRQSHRHHAGSPAPCDRSGASPASLVSGGDASPSTRMVQPTTTPDLLPDKSHHQPGRRRHHHHLYHHRHRYRHDRAHARSESDERLPDGAAPRASLVYANLNQHESIVRSGQLCHLGTDEAIDMQSAHQKQHQQRRQQQGGVDEQAALKNHPDGPDSIGGDQNGRDFLVDNERVAAAEWAATFVARDMNGSFKATAAAAKPAVVGQQQGNILADIHNDGCPSPAPSAGLPLEEAHGRRPTSGAKKAELDLADLEELQSVVATRAVQYRDSIENRYLFPTDDIIDSTLEADLETLSQARYGRFGAARSSVSNCSSEDSRRRRRRRGRGRGRRRRNNHKQEARLGGRGRSRNHRDYQDDEQDDDDDVDNNQSDQDEHRHSSAMRRNIILKSLRSLVVSCLSANEQQSAATTPTNKSNNHHQRHHHKQHQRQEQLCGVHGNANDGSGLDGDYANVLAAAPDECCCRFDAPPPAQFGNGQSDDYGAELHYTATTNEIIASHHQVDQLSFNKACQPPPAFMSWKAEEEMNANYYMNLELANGGRGRGYDYDYTELEDDRENSLDCDRFDGARHGQRGSSAVSCQSRRRRRPLPLSQLPAERCVNQISSSSDCGFSSASQNSMNLTNPSCSPTKFSEEEQRRLSQIYKRLAARLAGARGGGGDAARDTGQRASATSEDLLRLKRALIEIHSESCCQNTRCPSPHDRRNEASHVGDDAPSHSQPDQSSTKVTCTSQHQQDGTSPERGMESEAPEPGHDIDEPKRGFAGAFELKLTLSINPGPTTTSTTTTHTATTKAKGPRDLPPTAVKSNSS